LVKNLAKRDQPKPKRALRRAINIKRVKIKNSLSFEQRAKENL